MLGLMLQHIIAQMNFWDGLFISDAADHVIASQLVNK
jgi:hypothetical protein